MEKYKKIITRENIINDFNYYDLVQVRKCLELDGIADINLTRLDLKTKNQEVIERNGVKGKLDYSNFYSLEYLKEAKEKAELAADIICGILELRVRTYNPNKRSKEASVQYWGNDQIEFFVIDYDETNKEWFIEKLEKTIPNPQNWSD